MTKAELIKKYGVEWYEDFKAKMNEYRKERYHNDTEFRAANKAKSNECTLRRYHNDDKANLNMRLRCTLYRYCHSGQIELIENYALAKVDNFKGWCIHHKLEIHDDYRNSKKDLIMMNLYYDRPPEELIFLTRTEHTKLHNLNRGGKK